MPYNPKIPTSITTVEELRQYVQDELHSIAQSVNETTAVDLRPIHRAPDNPREGMLIYADGTDFNPGLGAGTYEYRGGVWQKL